MSTTLLVLPPAAVAPLGANVLRTLRVEFRPIRDGRELMSPDERFIARLKGLQNGFFAWACAVAVFRLPCFQHFEHASDEAARGMFRFIENGERRPKAELLGVSGINAGDKGTHESIEQTRREFTADKRSNGLIRFGAVAVAKNIAKNGGACASAEKGRGQNRRTHGHRPKRAIEQNIARSLGIRENAVREQSQVVAKGSDVRVPAEALRAAFNQETVALHRLDDASCP